MTSFQPVGTDLVEAIKFVASNMVPTIEVLPLESVQWGGQQSPNVSAIRISIDGELELEARPPGNAAVHEEIEAWTPSLFTAVVPGRGPLEIEHGWSRELLENNGILEHARLDGFAWRAFDAASEPIRLWAARLQFSSETAPRVLWFPRGNIFVRLAASTRRGWRFHTPDGQILLLPHSDRKEWLIAFEAAANGAPPSSQLAVDVLATISFVFGCPVHIDILHAVSERGFQGGLAQLGLADLRPKHDLRNLEPLVRDAAKPEAEHVAWIVDLAERILRFLRSSLDSPLLVSLHLYTASLEGFVDTQFLLSWMATETLSTWASRNNRLKDAGPLRIADKARWTAWVKVHDSDIRTHAVPGKEESLVSRVQGSEFDRPSSVQRVFRGEGLGWTSDMADAELVRNSVAHEGSMNGGAARNWSADLRRVLFVKAMLTAVIAKLIGFDGPISDRAHPPTVPGWWTPKSAPTTSMFECA